MHTTQPTQDRPFRILVVDDDASITELIASVLEAEGMECVICHSGNEALKTLTTESVSLALLDIMMPGMDGFELCNRIKQSYDIPIVFLTARDGESDLVVSFTLGADDYIVKPFRPRELVARVRARLRRPVSKPDDGMIHTRDFDIDVVKRTAELRGIPLDLTLKEFDILMVLARHCGEAVSTQEIFEEVWKQPYGDSSANKIMVHVRHLRQKFAAIDDSEDFIGTEWGVGYILYGERGGKR